MKAISPLIFACLVIAQSGFCQKPDTIISPHQFMGIRLGETDFKNAGEILKRYSYKEPKLLFRSIRWRNGGHSTYSIHHYFIRIKHSKLQVVLYGYKSVLGIEISCSSRTNLSFQNMVLGRSRIKDIELDQNAWKRTIDSNGETYLGNDFKGITISIPGDTLDIGSRKWSNKRINRIKLSK
jgi:hypothetical protein